MLSGPGGQKHVLSIAKGVSQGRGQCVTARVSNITEKAMSVTSGPDKSLLRYFFGSWFHQDCTVEGDDWPEIVGEFRRQHAPAEAGQAADEIRQLLER